MATTWSGLAAAGRTLPFNLDAFRGLSCHYPFNVGLLLLLLDISCYPSTFCEKFRPLEYESHLRSAKREWWLPTDFHFRETGHGMHCLIILELRYLGGWSTRVSKGYTFPFTRIRLWHMVFRIYPMVTFGQPFVIIFDCALIKYPHINSLPFAYIVAVLPYPVDGTFSVFPSMYIFYLLYLFPSNVLWPCISYVVCLLLSSASHCLTGGLGLVRVGCLLFSSVGARVCIVFIWLGVCCICFPAFLGCAFFSLSTVEIDYLGVV